MLAWLWRAHSPRILRTSTTAAASYFLTVPLQTRDLKDKLKEWNTHPAHRASKSQLHLVPAWPGSFMFCGNSSPSQGVPTIPVQMSPPFLSSEQPADTVSDRHCLSALVQTSMQQSGSVPPSSFVPTAGPTPRLGSLFDFHAPRCSSPVPLKNSPTAECEPSLTVSSLWCPGQPGPGSASPPLWNHSPRMAGKDSPRVPRHPIHSCLTPCVVNMPASNAGIQHVPARFPIAAEDCEYRVMSPNCGPNGDDRWTAGQITGELYI